MLIVFGDESHDESCERVFAVAGLLGDQKQWDKLEPVWKTRTGGTCFHAAECECDQGDFRNTLHRENLKLYRDLTKILADSGLIGFGVAINLADYRFVFPSLLEDQPFYLCFADVVKYCAEVGCLSIPPATVKFIFDRNREREYNANFLYKHLASTSDWRLHAYLDKELSFASRQSSVGIQAADLLAREAMKHLDNQCGPVQRFPRASIRTLAKTNRFRFQYYIRVGLEALRKEAEELGDLPGAKMSDYRAWLSKYRRTDGMSARLSYLTVIDALEREARSEPGAPTGKEKVVE